MAMRTLRGIRFVLHVGVAVVATIELVIAVGVGLQALDASPDADFVRWVYDGQDRFMRPFEDMFDDAAIGDGDGVVDWSGVFALAAYAAFFLPLGMGLSWVAGRQREHDEQLRREAEATRQARLFGAVEPESTAPGPVPGMGARLRAFWQERRGRRAGPSSSKPHDGSADGAAPPNDQSDA